MKFFVDTADVDEIRDLADTGLLDGVTTNPSLIAKAGRNFKEVIKEICAIVEGPVSAEVAATEAVAMVEEGRTLAKIADNVTIKVPLTWDGLKACTRSHRAAQWSTSPCASTPIRRCWRQRRALHSSRRLSVALMTSIWTAWS